VNAVYDETSSIRQLIADTVPNISTIAPIYKTINGTQIGIRLDFLHDTSNGVGLKVINYNGSDVLAAVATTADGGSGVGTVKTQDNLTKVTDATSLYTVPTVNAVATEISSLRDAIETHVPNLYADEPVYKSTNGTNTSYGVRYSAGYSNGVTIGVKTVGTSKYLVASAQVASTARIGTVRTVSALTTLTDATLSYTVPTVNAVSYAVMSAIYTQLPPTETTITSNIYIEIGDQYVPWSGVMDVNRISPNSNNFAGRLYVEKVSGEEHPESWNMYVYNEIADGAGLQRGTRTSDNFGTVITWSKVEYIGSNYTEHMPVVVNDGVAGNTIAGNPGDMFVVPTVNAVYAEISRLEDMIPDAVTVVSIVISEVPVESHIHQYITSEFNSSTVFVTNTSEYHYHVSNFNTISNIYYITSNTYYTTSLNAYSGLSASDNAATGVDVWGLPANSTSYGMVIASSKIVSIAGAAASYTVPTLNAIWNLLHQGGGGGGGGGDDVHIVTKVDAIPPIYVTNKNSVGLHYDINDYSGVRLWINTVDNVESLAVMGLPAQI
jgi:hypothetical protein